MHIDQHMETEQTKQCQEFAPLSVIRDLCGSFSYGHILGARRNVTGLQT